MLSLFPGLFSSQVKSLELRGSINHGFIEVSRSSCGRLSLVAVGSRKGSAWQASVLGKRKQWQREAPLLPTSTFTKKRFLAPGKNHMGKNVFAHDSRAVFFLSPLQPLALVLPCRSSSQLFCLPALPAPGHLMVITQCLCCTISH